MPTIRGMNAKKRYLSNGGKPRVIDLFAGCGGFSLGCKLAGMELIGAIEQDSVACKTHARNFFKNACEEDSIHCRAHNIKETDPLAYIESLESKEIPDAGVDVLIGGPPCQAFARIGRAKLREVANCDRAHSNDDRVNLYLDYVRFVEALLPLAVVVENVPDMMNLAGRNVVGEMCKTLENIGYTCRYSLLNAVHFGVPQFRERVFIVAFHRSLGLVPTFPRPSHIMELPSGYMGTRSVAMKPLSENPCASYLDGPLPKENAKKAVSCYEALSDLPSITEHLSEQRSRGIRRFDTIAKYPYRTNVSEYARQMRNWSGYENESGVCDHITRFLPRDFETFRLMKPGNQYPEAHRVAVERFERAILEHNGKAPTPGSDAYELMRKQIIPPYDPSKFPNKWWKLEPGMPSKTLTAHIGKDTYSHIHYDSKQARTISVREAARLQSFPDGFVFEGAMNAAFRQIGNAVPPLLAFAIAKHTKFLLRKILA